MQWGDIAAALQAVCERLRRETTIGVDVETTLASQRLCPVQLATTATVLLIDALGIADLEPLSEVLSNPAITKVIHNASFERSVLGRFGIPIEPVSDTLELSRKLRGKLDGGHGLKAVCARELGLALDKSEQTSNWARRPLSERQLAYAAVDAEVLLRLYARLSGGAGGGDPRDDTTSATTAGSEYRRS